MAVLTKWKTYLAGAGLLGLALYQVSQAQYQEGITSVLAALAALGLRHELAK
jgi:hypothetical protein